MSVPARADFSGANPASKAARQAGGTLLAAVLLHCGGLAQAQAQASPWNGAGASEPVEHREDPAHAIDSAGPAWSVGGYGTLGLVHSNENLADFGANALNPGSAGYSRRWSADVDSRLGMQLSLRLNPAWSAVLQLVSERSLAHGWSPALEWANLQYQATPDLSLRLGRIALPVFLAGDYRKAGYALPWVRPPVELYGATAISNSDGVDATWRWAVGGVCQVTQVFFGRSDTRLTQQARATARGLTGVSNTTTAGALTLRTSVMSTLLNVDLARPLFDAMRQFGPQGTALAERYDVSAKRADLAAIGFSYDPGHWFAMGELGRFNGRSFLGDKTAGYLSGGIRHGNLTPYLMLSASRANTATEVAGLDLAGLPAPLAAAGAGLNAGLNGLLGAIARQHTVSAGLRWDLRANYALKLQADRVTPLAGSSGTLINVQPGFRSGRAIGVLSAALNFVF